MGLQTAKTAVGARLPPQARVLPQAEPRGHREVRVGEVQRRGESVKARAEPDVEGGGGGGRGQCAAGEGLRGDQRRGAPRATGVRAMTFDNEDELLKGAFRAFPKLKTSKDKFEYGYRLRGKIPIRSNDAGSCNPHDHFRMLRSVLFLPAFL